MIASIFNKSKPINIVLAGLMVLCSFFLKQILSLAVLDFESIIRLVLGTLVVLFSVFIIDFISKKNALSDQNSFMILLYVLFFGLFDNALDNANLLVANVFILLGLWKTISLSSELNTTKRIFDAALWIGVATIFHSSAIIYLFVLFLSILFYVPNYYKNWLVPFVSLFVVFVISSVFQLYFFGEISFLKEISFHIPSCLNNFKNQVICILFAVLMVLGLILLPFTIREKTKKIKSSYLLIAFILLCSTLLLFLTHTTAVLIFMYFPLSCLLSLFLEKLDVTIQSIIIYLFVLVVIGINFL